VLTGAPVVLRGGESRPAATGPNANAFFRPVAAGRALVAPGVKVAASAPPASPAIEFPTQAGESYTLTAAR
jgi:hypothetical protein